MAEVIFCLVLSDTLHVHSSRFFCSVVPPRITKRSKDKVTVIEGNPLLLLCEAEGFPVPIITWTKNGKLQTESENRTKFIVHDTRKEDAGEYKCEASNSAGRASYKSTVKVTCKGEFLLALPCLVCSQYIQSFNRVLTHSLAHTE